MKDVYDTIASQLENVVSALNTNASIAKGDFHDAHVQIKALKERVDENDITLLAPTEALEMQDVKDMKGISNFLKNFEAGLHNLAKENLITNATAHDYYIGCQRFLKLFWTQAVTVGTICPNRASNFARVENVWAQVRVKFLAVMRTRTIANLTARQNSGAARLASHMFHVLLSTRDDFESECRQPSLHVMRGWSARGLYPPLFYSRNTEGHAGGKRRDRPKHNQSFENGALDPYRLLCISSEDPPGMAV